MRSLWIEKSLPKGLNSSEFEFFNLHIFSGQPLYRECGPLSRMRIKRVVQVGHMLFPQPVLLADPHLFYFVTVVD